MCWIFYWLLKTGFAVCHKSNLSQMHTQWPRLIFCIVKQLKTAVIRKIFNQTLAKFWVTDTYCVSNKGASSFSYDVWCVSSFFSAYMTKDLNRRWITIRSVTCEVKAFNSAIYPTRFWNDLDSKSWYKNYTSRLCVIIFRNQWKPSCQTCSRLFFALLSFPFLLFALECLSYFERSPESLKKYK